MDCSINSGRLLEPCLDVIAGVRTFFFMQHDDLQYTTDADGVIIDLAPAYVFRFEQAQSQGEARQTLIRGTEESRFLYDECEAFWFRTRPDDLVLMNALRAGRWAIFYLDYERNIRLLGAETAMVAKDQRSISGQAAEDSKWFMHSYHGNSSDYAPFLAPFTEYPFDNFPVVVVPPYVESELIINLAGDNLLINVADILLKDG